MGLSGCMGAVWASRVHMDRIYGVGMYITAQVSYQRKYTGNSKACVVNFAIKFCKTEGIATPNDWLNPIDFSISPVT